MQRKVCIFGVALLGIFLKEFKKGLARLCATSLVSNEIESDKKHIFLLHLLLIFAGSHNSLKLKIAEF